MESTTYLPLAANPLVRRLHGPQTSCILSKICECRLAVKRSWRACGGNLRDIWVPLEGRTGSGLALGDGLVLLEQLVVSLHLMHAAYTAVRTISVQIGLTFIFKVDGALCIDM